ncbi:hypothetical protein PIB30_024853 [Stylosanthes scabra]|uniref:Uncharacterized protein n=1 Tax=Stylosanthes scabra TaxID=79078 RepID=A0ABU6Z7I4_9FABA|nr:hypothetical protein [Stylosanthes scabra]
MSGSMTFPLTTLYPLVPSIFSSSLGWGLTLPLFATALAPLHVTLLRILLRLAFLYHYTSLQRISLHFVLLCCALRLVPSTTCTKLLSTICLSNFVKQTIVRV